VENVVTKDGVIIEKFDVLVFYQVDPGNGNAPSGSRFPFSETNTLGSLIFLRHSEIEQLRGVALHKSVKGRSA